MLSIIWAATKRISNTFSSDQILVQFPNSVCEPQLKIWEASRQRKTDIPSDIWAVGSDIGRDRNDVELWGRPRHVPILEIFMRQCLHGAFKICRMLQKIPTGYMHFIRGALKKKALKDGAQFPGYTRQEYIFSMKHPEYYCNFKF